jgi:hypothetical protein
MRKRHEGGPMRWLAEKVSPAASFAGTVLQATPGNAFARFAHGFHSIVPIREGQRVAIVC